MSTASRGTSNINTLVSPSSPDLPASIPVPQRMVTRSRTLPRSISISQPPLFTPDHGVVPDSLSMEPKKIERLRKWILALVIVDFDLDIGPKVSGIYPPLSLSPSEEANIAFSSFPDAPQFEQGALVHSFRIRAQNPSKDNLCRPDSTRPATEDGFIYGYAHFTQRRDIKSKRGYQQRSLVILSCLSYPALFHHLVSMLGPSCLNHGAPMMEAACHDIAGWSNPLLGSTLELGFLGSVLRVTLPEAPGMAQSSVTLGRRNGVSEPLILASLAPSHPPIVSLFEASLSHLWSIWECLVLCEPILVFANSPSETSQVIWWLRDILRPIPVAGDFRPFFTIHDADCSTLVNPRPPNSGILLGVTNPVFQQSCKHWPHVLSLGRSHAMKNKNAKEHVLAGPLPGWTTKTHRRYINKDRAILKQIEEACRSDDRAKEAASSALRDHLSARTTALLVPLQRYVHTMLIPTPTEPSRMKPFSSSSFLTSLKLHGSPLPFRSASRQREFYERWLRTPAFGVWIARQEELVQSALNVRSERAS